jgi:hypothetical protein
MLRKDGLEEDGSGIEEGDRDAAVAMKGARGNETAVGGFIEDQVTAASGIEGEVGIPTKRSGARRSPVARTARRQKWI